MDYYWGRGGLAALDWLHRTISPDQRAASDPELEKRHAFCLALVCRKIGSKIV